MLRVVALRVPVGHAGPARPAPKSASQSSSPGTGVGRAERLPLRTIPFVLLVLLTLPALGASAAPAPATLRYAAVASTLVRCAEPGSLDLGECAFVDVPAGPLTLALADDRLGATQFEYRVLAPVASPAPGSGPGEIEVCLAGEATGSVTLELPAGCTVVAFQPRNLAATTGTATLGAA